MRDAAPGEAQARLARHLSFPLLASVCRLRQAEAQAHFHEVEGLPYG
jgi:hypothetical protein